MARLLSILVALLAVAAIALASARLLEAREGVSVRDVTIGATPATVFTPDRPLDVGGGPPVVVIAHGFAGSRVLMAPFATAFARNGYLAVTFDFLGHGENPLPLTGDVTEVEGATRALVNQTGEVADYARSLPVAGEGLAVLGHSMASDIVVRFASDNAAVDATVAVSMFSPAVTADEPENLLVIVGEWEPQLVDEALRVVGMRSAPEAPREGVTYGAFADGTAGRVVFSDDVEHIAVLYSRESLSEAVRWLDATFGVERPDGPVTSHRLSWIGLLVLGIVALAWPLYRLLPRIADPPAGAGLPWRRLWPTILVPAIGTPLLLAVVPTDFLPVVVGDYLAAHFLLYGLLTAGMLAAARRGARGARSLSAAAPAMASDAGRLRPGPLLLATLAVTLYGAGALGLAIDATITSFEPVAERVPLLLAMLVGTLAYFLTNEWATRGPGAARGGYAVAKVAFVLSIAIAVALDFERLFFLVIIVPVIVLFFIIYGLFSGWSYKRTGHPLPAAVANAVAFAWAITVTFPMLAG